MKNDKLNLGIKEIKDIKMTSHEKSKILESVLSFSVLEKKSIESPFKWYSFVSSFQVRKYAYYIIIPLIFILSGGGVVLASEDSLPDSILYPIKVKIVEPIGGALKFSAKEKARYESKLSVKRLAEAESLDSQNKLDSTKKKKISNLLLNHMTALDEAINKSKENEEVDEIITNFSDEMNARVKVLDVKKQQNDEQSLNKDENKKDDKKDYKNEDNKDEISNVVRLNTDKMKENRKKKKLDYLNKDIENKTSNDVFVNKSDSNMFNKTEKSKDKENNKSWENELE